VSLSTRDRGRAAEDAVAQVLERAGLEIIERNVTAGGVELDVVARERDPIDGWIYIFCEVRSRAEDALGEPIETVDWLKRSRLIKGATAWLVAHQLWERVAVRFDVVGLTGPDSNAPADIVWIRGAFEET